MQNRVIFIIPYFGQFNNYFQLFLESCKTNPDFNWLILTDDRTQYEYPDNVIVKYTTFEKVVELIKSKFNFNITLHKPYKLCDYKIAYGYIFEEYIKGYDFWGYCDVDLIWGDIKKFISDDLLNQYDRLMARGHLTLFRNEGSINKLFMYTDNEMFIDYRYAFSTKYCCHFDELEEWGTVLKKRGVRQWYQEIFADIDCNTKRFTLVYGTNKNNNQIFVRKEGSLIRYYIDDNVVKKDEWIYIHLQKRTMKTECKLSSDYCIVPNEFVSLPNEMSLFFVDEYSKDNSLYLQRRKERIKEIIKNVVNGALRFRWKKLKGEIKWKKL